MSLREIRQSRVESMSVRLVGVYVFTRLKLDFPIKYLLYGDISLCH